MVDLRRAFEIDEGIISNGVVIPQSILSTTRSYAIDYSGDFINKVTFYNTLLQINSNRVAECVLSYSGDLVTGETINYFEEDGVTVYASETNNYIYSGDILTKVETT